jgi:tetratricopeptide (TPR) repeat protein
MSPSTVPAGRALIVAAGLLAAACWTPAGVRAETHPQATTTLLGSYLAGRIARMHYDTTAAAQFYRRALQGDPGDTTVIESSFLAEAAEGNEERANELARHLIARQQSHRIAHIWLATAAVKARDYDAAYRHLARASGGGPVGELTTVLGRAWIRLAEGKSSTALELVRSIRVAEAAQTYVRYHRALIADLAGRRSEASREFEAVFKQDQRTPRIALAYARHAASGGDIKLARSILEQHLERAAGDPQPMVLELQKLLDGKHVIKLLIESPTQGYSELFYGLGEALSTEGGVALGSLYLQMALVVRPNAEFTLAALANLYELTKRYDAAIATYDRIRKGTPLERSIQVRKAVNLNLLDRVEEARTLLDKLAEADPSDVRPLVTAGDIMRSHKRYEESIEYYNRVLAATPNPEPRHWTYWYARGTSYERLKKWPQAEADLLKALELSPDQPLVLNYLGYSWVDQNRNLKQGMAMIEKAVAARPDDGYIVDSLGWAHYRLGNYKEAVRYLERAVELRPEDPTLNDHLGDGYWRVGRRREARFQWEQALTLKPEPEEVEKIKRKLNDGLAALAPTKTSAKRTKQTRRTEAPRKRVDNQPAPIAPFQ